MGRKAENWFNTEGGRRDLVRGIRREPGITILVSFGSFETKQFPKHLHNKSSKSAQKVQNVHFLCFISGFSAFIIEVKLVNLAGHCSAKSQRWSSDGHCPPSMGVSIFNRPFRLPMQWHPGFQKEKCKARWSEYTHYQEGVLAYTSPITERFPEWLYPRPSTIYHRVANTSESEIPPPLKAGINQNWASPLTSWQTRPHIRNTLNLKAPFIYLSTRKIWTRLKVSLKFHKFTIGVLSKKCQNVEYDMN